MTVVTVVTIVTVVTVVTIVTKKDLSQFFSSSFIFINLTKLDKLICDEKLKTQIVTKVKNSNGDKTQKLKL